MDSKNLFESKTTYGLIRLEYLFGLLFCLWLLIEHFHEINWWVFILLFSYIDLIGYIPGAIAYRCIRSEGPHRAIPKTFYVLYNATHSFLTAGLVVTLWWHTVGAEWALLAVPIHLIGDRAVFGNFLKPFGVSFEPRTHPAFANFQDHYAKSAS